MFNTYSKKKIFHFVRDFFITSSEDEIIEKFFQLLFRKSFNESQRYLRFFFNFCFPKNSQLILYAFFENTSKGLFELLFSDCFENTTYFRMSYMYSFGNFSVNFFRNSSENSCNYCRGISSKMSLVIYSEISLRIPLKILQGFFSKIFWWFSRKSFKNCS